MKTPVEKVRDTGTDLLSRRRRVVVRLNPRYAYDLYVVDGSDSDRLLLAEIINTNQHSTLDSFTVLLHRANMMGPKSPATERSSGKDYAHISHNVAIHMARVSKLMKYLHEKLPRSTVDLLLSIGLDEGVSIDTPNLRTTLTSGLEVLRIGLDLI